MNNRRDELSDKSLPQLRRLYRELVVTPTPEAQIQLPRVIQRIKQKQREST